MPKSSCCWSFCENPKYEQILKSCVQYNASNESALIVKFYLNILGDFCSENVDVIDLVFLAIERKFSKYVSSSSSYYLAKTYIELTVELMKTLSVSGLANNAEPRIRRIIHLCVSHKSITVNNWAIFALSEYLIIFRCARMVFDDIRKLLRKSDQSVTFLSSLLSLIRELITVSNSNFDLLEEYVPTIVGILLDNVDKNFLHQSATKNKHYSDIEPDLVALELENIKEKSLICLQLLFSFSSQNALDTIMISILCFFDQKGWEDKILCRDVLILLSWQCYENFGYFICISDYVFPILNGLIALEINDCCSLELRRSATGGNDISSLSSSTSFQYFNYSVLSRDLRIQSLLMTYLFPAQSMTAGTLKDEGFNDDSRSGGDRDDRDVNRSKNAYQSVSEKGGSSGQPKKSTDKNGDMVKEAVARSQRQGWRVAHILDILLRIIQFEDSFFQRNFESRKEDVSINNHAKAESPRVQTTPSIHRSDSSSFHRHLHQGKQPTGSHKRLSSSEKHHYLGRKGDSNHSYFVWKHFQQSNVLHSFNDTLQSLQLLLLWFSRYFECSTFAMLIESFARNKFPPYSIRTEQEDFDALAQFVQLYASQPNYFSKLTFRDLFEFQFHALFVYLDYLVSHSDISIFQIPSLTSLWMKNSPATNRMSKLMMQLPWFHMKKNITPSLLASSSRINFEMLLNDTFSDALEESWKLFYKRWVLNPETSSKSPRSISEKSKLDSIVEHQKHSSSSWYSTSIAASTSLTSSGPEIYGNDNGNSFVTIELPEAALPQCVRCSSAMSSSSSSLDNSSWNRVVSGLQYPWKSLSRATMSIPLQLSIAPAMFLPFEFKKWNGRKPSFPKWPRLNFNVQIEFRTTTPEKWWEAWNYLQHSLELHALPRIRGHTDHLITSLSSSIPSELSNSSSTSLSSSSLSLSSLSSSSSSSSSFSQIAFYWESVSRVMADMKSSSITTTAVASLMPSKTPLLMSLEAWALRIWELIVWEAPINRSLLLQCFQEYLSLKYEMDRILQSPQEQQNFLMSHGGLKESQPIDLAVFPFSRLHFELLRDLFYSTWMNFDNKFHLDGLLSLWPLQLSLLEVFSYDVYLFFIPMYVAIEEQCYHFDSGTKLSFMQSQCLSSIRWALLGFWSLVARHFNTASLQRYVNMYYQQCYNHDDRNHVLYLNAKLSLDLSTFQFHSVSESLENKIGFASTSNSDNKPTLSRWNAWDFMTEHTQPALTRPRLLVSDLRHHVLQALIPPEHASKIHETFNEKYVPHGSKL